MSPALLIPKTKTLQKEKIIGQYPDEHRCKNPQQNICKLIPTMY